MKQGWFSTTKEAIYEQRQLVAILEHAGVNVLDVVGDSAEFSFEDGRALIEKSAKLAYKNKLPVAKGFSRQKDFVNKMLGNWMEYQFDAVINSRRFSLLLPSRWVKSVHRSEYEIPDLERGSPDRIALDNNGEFNALISIKLLGDIKKSPENLDAIFSWSVTHASKYKHKLGLKSNTVPDCGLYTNANSGKGLVWPGGKVCYGLKGNTIYDILDNSVAATNWWRDFFAELKHNVDSVGVLSSVTAVYKTPDAFQQSQVVDVVNAHTGAGVVNAACGFGKTVCQMATLPKTRSISLYMPGARLALAGQANGELDVCLGVESHRMYVMSSQEFQKRIDSNIRTELSVNATTPNKIAMHIVDYALGVDPCPLIILSIVQSINKVFNALELIRDGNVVDETGQQFDWCTDQALTDAVWQKVLELLHIAHYDEAHNLVTGAGADEDNPKEKLKTQKYLKWANTLFKKSIFWTATVVKNKVDAGYDMRNIDVFGEVIAVVRPGTAISEGYTVPPKLIPVRLPDGAIYSAGIKGNDDADLELTYYIKAIEDAYHRLQDEQQPCQLLLFTSNVAYHETFKQKLHDHFKTYNSPIWCNYVEAETDADTRQRYFKEFSNAKFSVLMNYNIVAEGIDIASCTGVVIGRGMLDKTYVQVAGRPCRLSVDDRADIRSGVLEKGEWSTYRKKYGLVYVFVDESDADSVSEGSQLYSLIDAMLKTNELGTWWIESSLRCQLTGKQKKDLEKQGKLSPDVDAIFDIAVASQMVVSEETTLLIAAKLIEAERKTKATEDLNMFYSTAMAA